MHVFRACTSTRLTYHQYAPYAPHASYAPARVFTLINRHLTHLCFVLLQILLCLLAPYVPARLYSHQYLPYAPLFSLVRNTVVSVVSVVCWPPRKKTFNIVRNDHGHTQRCEFSD